MASWIINLFEKTSSTTKDTYLIPWSAIANKPDIPSAVTESTVAGWGFTKNTGTITGIKMNGASKGTSGVVDLGTVLTNASLFATSAQGTKADNAMPKSGGTFTGEVKFGNTENFQGYYIKRMIGSLGAGTRYADLDSSYKDGTWHRMWRLRFPSGSSFWGKIKITLYGGYSSFNASGVMSKSITCNFNTSNIYNNVGCYDGLGVNVEQDFRISEAIWNATASAWEVLIWQKNLSGNNSPVIMLECWTTNNTNYIKAFNGIAAQPVELTQSTSYSAQKASPTGGTKTVEWATLPVYENPLGEEIATVAMLDDKQDKITSSNKLSASLVSGLSTVATSGSYNDLSNKPTIPDVSGKLDKTAYEENKTINFGSTGVLKIGKFKVYDTNVTCEITSTTNVTYSGKLVIATQNYVIQQMTVYGDAANTIAPNIFVKPSTTSDPYIEVYFKPSSWSKNVIHIYGSAIAEAPTDVCTNVSAVPSTATSKPTNALNSKANLSGGNTFSGNNQFDGEVILSNRFEVANSGEGQFAVGGGVKGVRIDDVADGDVPLVVGTDAGTAGQVLTSQGADATPQWKSMPTYSLSGTTLTITLP